MDFMKNILKKVVKMNKTRTSEVDGRMTLTKIEAWKLKRLQKRIRKYEDLKERLSKELKRDRKAVKNLLNKKWGIL